MTAELLLRLLISVNQLSVYGAVADRRREFSQRIAAHSFFSTANLVAKVNNDSESQVPFADVANLAKPPMFSVGARGNSVQQHNEKFGNLPADLRVTEACDDAGFKRYVSPGQFFGTIRDIQLAGFGCTSSCRESYASSR